MAGLLECFVPTPDRRTRLPYHVGLGILLRSILTEREPLYRLGEVVETFAPEGFGLTEEQAHGLADDAMGRALDHLFDEDRGSRFVTVMPRSRLEDNELRAWIQDHEPEWERVWDRENPRRKGGPRDRWFVWKHHLPSREGWPVIWVFSHLLRHKQGQSRRERIARAVQELSDLAHHHLYGRPRNRARTEVWNQVTSILEAHKRQPVIESRFKQTKTVHEIAPVLLKNEGRIEALFFLYFVALLVSALLERDLHRAMAREEIGELPLYPEERKTPRPTAEQVLRLFSPAQRHRLYREGKEVEVFSPRSRTSRPRSSPSSASLSRCIAEDHPTPDNSRELRYSICGMWAWRREERGFGSRHQGRRVVGVEEWGKWPDGILVRRIGIIGAARPW